jgi:hypothetical protein
VHILFFLVLPIACFVLVNNAINVLKKIRLDNNNYLLNVVLISVSLYIIISISIFMIITNA